MGTVVKFERQGEAGWIPMQWRGSDDGVTWTPWTPLLRVRSLVPYYAFYQARILIDGGWLTSPVVTDEVF